MEIPNYSFDELLETLKPYQRISILNLIEKYGDEEAAKKWLMANGPADTIKFGGQQMGDPQPFWDKLMAEFRAIVCGDEKYKKEVDSLLEQAKPVALVVVTSISTLLATSLGIAAALISPVVVILLKMVCKVGINMWCKSVE